jgi:hypothetical protein
MASVSAEDRRRMARQAEALQAFDTQEPGDEDQRAEAIAEANAEGAAIGLDELKTEGEFHRKAALGLIRR